MNRKFKLLQWIGIFSGNGKQGREGSSQVQDLGLNIYEGKKLVPFEGNKFLSKKIVKGEKKEHIFVQNMCWCLWNIPMESQGFLLGKVRVGDT